MTTSDGSGSCAVCHGEGKESDVETVNSGIHYADIVLEYSGT